MKLEDMLLKIPAPIIKGFVVGGNILLSSVALYRTIEYSSNGEMGKATIAGICSVLAAYVAGYQSKRNFK